MSVRVPGGFASAQAFLDAFADDVGALIAYIDTEARVRFVSQRNA